MSTPSLSSASPPIAPELASPTRPIRIAIISDLHAHSGKDPTSFISADPSTGDLRGDPLTHLLAHVKGEGKSREELKADILLCGGDLADRGSEQGLVHAWDQVNRLKDAIGAEHLAATPGNHDLIHASSEAPDGGFKNLSPVFPPLPSIEGERFWRHHFGCIDASTFRIVCLNSIAHHTKEDERKKGRVSQTTLKALGHWLDTTPRRATQILLCHHHPHQHADYGLGETDVIVHGQLLLDLLSHHGQWLVVHGHKHHPKLTRAAGNSAAPWVLAAGSIGAFPNPNTVGKSRNQFYLVEMDPSSFSSIGWGGRIRAWDWAPYVGWEPASNQSGLPAEFGFGYSGDLSLLAARILRHLPASGHAEWSQLMALEPVLGRVCPRDIAELHSLGLSFEYTNTGVPYQVTRA